MSFYYGDYPASHTAVCMDFDSFAGSTGAPSATSNFAAGDIQIYKDGGTTQRSSSAGIVVSTSFDGSTGLQMITIDLSDNTDAGFYAAGHEYNVAVADVTIDSQTMRFWVGSFSIERAGGALALLKAGTAKVTLADAVAHGGTLGSSTATLALSRLNITSQTSNTVGLTVAGNGSGNGATITGGATGHGLSALGGATSGDGISAAAQTSGHGLTVTGVGTTKHGINAAGGSTSSHGISAVGGGTGNGGTFTGGASDGKGMAITAGATNADGLRVTGTGTGHGFNAQSGAGATGNGINALSNATNGTGLAVAGAGTGAGILATSGAGATGNGITAVSTATNGHGFSGTGVGTGDGMRLTGGGSAGGDGLDCVAGGGVDIRGAITGAITGNITGNLSGSVGSVAAGGITAASIATDAIDADALADGAITAATFAAGAIDAAAIATDAIDADALKADAATEIADAFLNRNMATGTDSGSSTVRTPRQALRVLRNMVDLATTPGTMDVKKEDDSTSSWTATLTTSASADPITIIDPAGP